MSVKVELALAKNEESSVEWKPDEKSERNAIGGDDEAKENADEGRKRAVP